MTIRRQLRRDALADRVANGFLPDDLKRGLADNGMHEDLVLQLLEEAHHLKPGDRASTMLAQHLMELRMDPNYGPILSVYLGPAAKTPRCQNCCTELADVPPGRRGRRPEYCSNRCRQRVYRRRRYFRKHGTILSRAAAVPTQNMH